MPWEKSSPKLVDLFRRLAPTGPNIQLKPMFGYEAAFVNGKLFTALFRESMVFKLPPSDAAAFLDQPGTLDFEPMPGRKMNGFVLFRDPFTVSEDELINWMKCALEFVSRIPARKKAAAGKKTVPRKK